MKFKSGDMYVEVFVEDFRTRVRLPAPPPFNNTAKSNKPQKPLRIQGLFYFIVFSSPVHAAVVHTQ